jgi:hypothetical protein
LDQFVLPCVKCWQLDPLNVRKAVIAISQIDILADHVIIHQHPSFTRGQLANVRKATEQNSPIRLLVRDVHDTHKHGPLQRATATITTGERPKLERTRWSFPTQCFPEGVRYWQRPLFLHLFNYKAQYQKRYWPNSYPNSQSLCMSFLKDRS